MGKDILMRAHVVSQKLNREQTKEYYTNTKIEFPDNYLIYSKNWLSIHRQIYMHRNTHMEREYSVPGKIFWKTVGNKPGDSVPNDGSI